MTTAYIASIGIGAIGVGVTVVDAFALVFIYTTDPVASKTRLAVAAVGPIASHVAVGIGVTGVVALVEAKVSISTGEAGLHCVKGRIVVVARKNVIRRVAIVIGSDWTVSIDTCCFVYRQFGHSSESDT